MAPNRIVVEATGGRTVPLATALQAAGLSMALVNPRQAREFGPVGMGLVVAAVLIAELPELGHLNGYEIATLTGMASLNRDSGRYCDQHRVWGRSASVRTMLYMVTVIATRPNLVIRDFHTCLCQ